MLSLDRKKERERVRTRDESSLNHLYLSTIIWSGDETCLIVSTDIPASCFDIMFRCLVSVLFLQNRAQSHARQMTMFFHDPVPEMESVMLINYALQFEATNNYLYPKKCLMQEGEKLPLKARLLRQVKGLVAIALFLNSWLCALRSVSSNDFVRSIAYKLQSACFDDLGCAYGHDASLQYLERLPQLQ